MKWFLIEEDDQWQFVGAYDGLVEAAKIRPRSVFHVARTTSTVRTSVVIVTTPATDAAVAS